MIKDKNLEKIVNSLDESLKRDFCKQCFDLNVASDFTFEKTDYLLGNLNIPSFYLLYYSHFYYVNYANLDECNQYFDFLLKCKDEKETLVKLFQVDNLNYRYYFNKICNFQRSSDFDYFKSKVYYYLYATEKEKAIYNKAMKNKDLKKLLPNNDRRCLIAFARFVRCGAAMEPGFQALVDEFNGLALQTIIDYPKNHYRKTNDYERKLYDDSKENYALAKKQKMQELCYKSYVMCEKYSWDKKKLYDFAHENGVTVMAITKYAKTYMLENLGYNDETYHEYVSNRYQTVKNSQNNHNIILEKLASIDDDDQVYPYLRYVKMSFPLLKTKIADYVAGLNLQKEEAASLAASLSRKIDLAIKEKSNRKSKVPKRDEVSSSKLKKDIALLCEAMSSPAISASSFCTQKGISMIEFNAAIESVRLCDFDTYSKYVNAMKEKYERSVKEFQKKLPIIINYLKNGVPISKEPLKRNFDLLDYYLLTSFPIDKALSAALPVLDSSNYNKLKVFIMLNENVEKLKKEKILSNAQIERFNCKFDENRQYIEGSGVEIGQEDKAKVVKFLEDNNIPLNNKTYRIALRRYADAKTNGCDIDNLEMFDIYKMRKRNKH